MRFIKYRLKWFFAPYFNFKSPIHIDLELNNNCNQSCKMCWHSGKPPFKISIIKTKTINKTIEFCKKNKVESIKFNWRGEPLMNIDRLSLYSNLFKRIGLYTMINTNGKNLKESLGQLDKIDEIIISVDSLSSNTYREIHNDNIDFMIDLLHWLKFLKTRNILKNKIKLNFHDNVLNQQEIIDNIDNYKLLFPFKIIHRLTENREGQDISIKQNRKRKKVCPHMKRRLTIASNGKIFPCCVAYKEPDDLFLGYDLNAAWSGIMRKELIDNYKKGIFTETCKNCSSGDIYA